MQLPALAGSEGASHLKDGCGTRRQQAASYAVPARPEGTRRSTKRIGSMCSSGMISSARSGVSTSRKPRSWKNSRNVRGTARHAAATRQVWRSGGNRPCRLSGFGFDISSESFAEGRHTTFSLRRRSIPAIGLTLCGKQRRRHPCPASKRRHRAVEHIANRSQQLAFFDRNGQVGTDAGRAGIDQPGPQFGRCFGQLAQSRIQLADAARFARQKLHGHFAQMPFAPAWNAASSSCWLACASVESRTETCWPSC